MMTGVPSARTMPVWDVDMFIAMPACRGVVSMVIVIFKWLGTLAPTIQFYGQTGSRLILALWIGCFIYDVFYMGMLYLKFRELKLNPFTHRPVEQT